jgi:hypothetical protein
MGPSYTLSCFMGDPMEHVPAVHDPVTYRYSLSDAEKDAAETRIADKTRRHPPRTPSHRISLPLARRCISKPGPILLHVRRLHRTSAHWSPSTIKEITTIQFASQLPAPLRVLIGSKYTFLSSHWLKSYPDGKGRAQMTHKTTWRGTYTHSDPRNWSRAEPPILPPSPVAI